MSGSNPNRIISLVYVVVGPILTFLCAGILWGWASLLPVLEKERVYYDECPQSSEPDNQPFTCEKQITRLNLIFTIGVVFANVTSLPAGILLDRYGSAKPLHIGSVVFGVGCVLFGLSANYGFDGYIPAFITLGIGSAIIFLSLLGIANFFPKYMSTILSFLNCAFDASVFVFYLFQAVYNHTSLRIGTIFIGYSFISIGLTLCALFWPKIEVKEESMDDSLLDNATEMGTDEQKPSEPIPPKKADPTIWEKARSFEFIFIAIYLSVNQMWLNTYIGTLEVQLREVYSESTASTLMTIFALTLPFGFLGSPAIGYLLDNKGMKMSFTVLGSGLVLFSFLQLLKHVFVIQVINTVIFTFVRALFYAGVVSFYFKVFGYKSFGRLFGISQVLSGATGFLQSAFLSMSYNLFDGHFLAMNLIQLFSVILLGLFPLYWTIVENRRKRMDSAIVE